jgi:hypothetical protein
MNVVDALCILKFLKSKKKTPAQKHIYKQARGIIRAHAENALEQEIKNWLQPVKHDSRPKHAEGQLS